MRRGFIDESREKGEAGDEEEDDDQMNVFPVYSARSQQDMSAMVSALSQVIGSSSSSSSSNPNFTANPSFENTITSGNSSSVLLPQDQSPNTLLQEQGN